MTNHCFEIIVRNDDMHIIFLDYQDHAFYEGAERAARWTCDHINGHLWEVRQIY